MKEDSESRTAHGTLTDKVRDTWSTPRAKCNVTGAKTMRSPSEGGSSSKPGLAQQVMWPTPQSYSKGNDENSAPGLTPLDLMVRPELKGSTAPLWPTPMTTDANSAGRHATQTGVMHPGTSLTDAMREQDWRSPSSRDWKGPSAQSWRDRATGDPTQTLCDQIVGLPDPESLSASGNLPVPSYRPVLNPRWVACLMGFPPDWMDGVESPPSPRRRSRRGDDTRSARSATPSSRKSRKSSHGVSAPSSPEVAEP